MLLRDFQEKRSDADLERAHPPRAVVIVTEVTSGVIMSEDIALIIRALPRDVRAQEKACFFLFGHLKTGIPRRLRISRNRRGIPFYVPTAVANVL